MILLVWLTLACNAPSDSPPEAVVAPVDAPPVEPPPPASPPFVVPEVDLGSDPCDTAWDEFSAFAGAITTANAGRKPVPTKEAFLAACAALPVDTRPCMSAAYALVHPDACQSRFDALSSADRDALYKALARPAAP